MTRQENEAAGRRDAEATARTLERQREDAASRQARQRREPIIHNQRAGPPRDQARHQNHHARERGDPDFPTQRAAIRAQLRAVGVPMDVRRMHHQGIPDAQNNNRRFQQFAVYAPNLRADARHNEHPTQVGIQIHHGGHPGQVNGARPHVHAVHAALNGNAGDLLPHRHVMGSYDHAYYDHEDLQL